MTTIKVIAIGAPNAQTGTTYTLALGDEVSGVTLSNTSAITLTVPTNASAAFPVGVQIPVAQINSGQVTIAGASGVTVQSADSKFKLRVSGSSGTLWKLGTDTWLLLGDLAS